MNQAPWQQRSGHPNPIQIAASPVRFCLLPRYVAVDHQETVSSLLPQAQDHSWADQGEVHSGKSHDADRKRGSLESDRSDRHRSLLDNDHDDGDRLLLEPLDLLLHCRGRSSGDLGR
jgi:hypothetical protein